MDLSVFLLLLFVTLNFVAECYSWNQYKVKLGIFISTLIITLPNITFMVIDWWQSPHSKMALLVLNTFKPVLRGETYRLFRWLKSIGIDLTSDELNYLPISVLGNSSDFFMTRECYLASRSAGFKVIPEDDGEFGPYNGEFGSYIPGLAYNKCVGFAYEYGNQRFVVHQLKSSRKLNDLWRKFGYEGFISHCLFKSSRIRSRTYTNVDVPTGKRLAMRLMKICNIQIPILAKFEYKGEWYYFNAVSTLDYLNEDLVLIQGQGEAIAVG